jgi:hypothetical protein
MSHAIKILRSRPGDCGTVAFVWFTLTFNLVWDRGLGTSRYRTYRFAKDPNVSMRLSAC